MPAAAVSTLAEVLRPSVAMPRWAYDLALIATGSLIVAACAQLDLIVPGSPVPMTGQSFAVLLVGALLGGKRGALSIVAYLLEGASGLPVFAGGAAGAAYLVGPTGGYLVGFVAAAFITGTLAERGWDRRFSTMALAMLAGNAALFLLGVLWLSMYLGSVKAAAIVGLLPFIPLDAGLKIALATALLPLGWKLLGAASPK